MFSIEIDIPPSVFSSNSNIKFRIVYKYIVYYFHHHCHCSSHCDITGIFFGSIIVISQS